MKELRKLEEKASYFDPSAIVLDLHQLEPTRLYCDSDRGRLGIEAILDHLFQRVGRPLDNLQQQQH